MTTDSINLDDFHPMGMLERGLYVAMWVLDRGLGGATQEVRNKANEIILKALTTEVTTK